MAYLLAGFDTARMGTITLAGSDDGGPWSVDLPAGTYAHRDLSSVMGAGNYVELASVLETLANGATSGIGTYVFWWNAATGYNIEYDSGFSLTFTGSSAAERMGQILGFSSDASGATFYQSTHTPYYALALDRDGPSEFSRPFETSGQTKRQVSSNGTAYSIGPRSRERRIKMSLKFQSLASTFADEADPSAPWTYEHLVMHARCHEPILLSYPGGDIVYKNIRGEFDEDSRRSAWNDYHGKWHLPVEGQYLGRL